MGYNFVSGDRDQLLLMPPSVAEWLDDDHLAWFVLDAVAELDHSAFEASYRVDGRGGAAYDPALMLGVLIYAYCVGERSSRRIERRLVEDVAFRVVAANQRPDHATLARFRARHQDAIAGLFGQVLGLCARAGLLRPELVAIDGTKLATNASRHANRTLVQLTEELAREVLQEAAEVDAAEDADAQAQAEQQDQELDLGLSRRGEARRIRLRELLEELQQEAEAKSYETHMAKRAEVEQATGRPIGGRQPKPTSKRFKSRQHANVTDPDSRLMKTSHGFQQGYNAQAAATTDQMVVAAQVSNSADDAPCFEPMVRAAQRNLHACDRQPEVKQAVADAGYWSKANVEMKDVDAFIAPTRRRKLAQAEDRERRWDEVLSGVEAGQSDVNQASAEMGVTPGAVQHRLRQRRKGEPDSATSDMMAKLSTPDGKRIYRKRAASIEPVFGQIKHNRGITRLSRRGLAAVDSEWKLICATHNLLKMWRAA